MSDLAFNINGEPIDLPSTTAAMRVKKIKPKGAPEVVYGRDGLPLFLPPDGDVEDLRREARDIGKFRLDPVDEHNRPIAGAQSAYVCVHPIERAPEPPPAPTLAAGGQAEITAALVAALLESQKQHTELARMYVSQFPVVANAMAGVVRSASDAGLTARVPLVVPAQAPASRPDEAAEHDDEAQDESSDESDDDETSDQADGEPLVVEVAPQPVHSWARVAQTLADQVSPHLGPLLSGLPGLAAMLGAKRAQTASDATRGPDHADPAPAEAEPRAPGAPGAGFDAGMLVRLNAIKAQLTPVERQFAQTLLDEIPAEELPIWFDRLHAMSVDDAVAYVRKMFREGQAAAASARPAEPPTRPRSAPAHAARTAPNAARRDGRRSTLAPTHTAQRPSRPSTPSNGLALFDEGTQAHLAAIDAALTHDEAAALRKQFAALPPRERASWVATLVVLPVADAVAAIRGQLAATDAQVAIQDPPGAAPSAPSNGSAPASHGGASSADDVGPSREAMDPPTLCTVPAAPRGETGTAPTEPATVRVSPDADSHLAAVEHGLTTEERIRMHTMFSGLSPDEREAWLNRLLSAPPAQGTEMIRATLGAKSAQPRLAPPQIDGAPVSAAMASTAGDASVIQSAAKAADRYEPVVDEIELDDAAALEDAEELADTTELADSAELADAAELADTTDLANTAEPDDATERDAMNEPHASPVAEGSITPHDTIGRRATGDARHAGATDSPPKATTATPTSTTDLHAHFRAIEAGLTLAERMRAHELAAQRPSAELARWYAELLRLSVPDAVAKIRAELVRSDGNPTTKKGDVP
jgi:hypothetical protein